MIPLLQGSKTTTPQVKKPGVLAAAIGKVAAPIKGILEKAKQSYAGIKDNSVLGVVKNTVLGLPKTAIEQGRAVQKIVAPSRRDDLERIQNERRQTLLPSKAKEIIQKEETKSGSLALTPVFGRKLATKEDRVAMIKDPSYGLSDQQFYDTKRFDLTGAIGAAKNVAAEGLEEAGKQLLRNIRNSSPDIIEKGKAVLDNSVSTARPLLAPRRNIPISDSVPLVSKADQIRQASLADISTRNTSMPEMLPPARESKSLSPQEMPLLRKENPSLEQDISQNFDPAKYVEEQVRKRNAAKKSDDSGILGKAKSLLAESKAKLVDSASPIEDVLYSAKKKSKISLLPQDDIHNQIDRVLRAPTLAGQFVEDGGLVDVIKKVENLDNLDQYLIAKHAKELEAKGVTTGRDSIKDGELIKQYGPEYEDSARKVSDYSKKLLDYSVDTGLISKELADDLKVKYPDYVPFSRVFSEVEKSGHGGTNAVASLSRQTAVQRIKGSTREIESPIESLMAKTNDVFKQGEKNKAAKMLASYEKLPGNPFSLREIKEGDSASHTITFFENGRKKTFETTKEISEAAKSLNVQQLNILGKIFAFPTRAARLGITGINLPFIGANLVKDQVSAFINSSKGLHNSAFNISNFGNALFSALAHDDLYKEMVRAGGAGTSFDISRNQVEQTVGRIRASRNLISRVKYTVAHPSELLRAVEDIVGRAEEVTRLQQYGGTKNALLREGFGEKDAIIGGAKQAREATVNFARKGEWGTVLNSAFLYLNASIQGTRTLLRSLKDRPVATSAKIVVSSMFPMAVATAWNLSDPKRKLAYEDIPEYEKENNMIIIPPNPTKDSKGKWNVIKIPLSQEINNVVSLARKPIEQASGLDQMKFQDFASALLGTVSPIAPDKGSILSAITPQALKPTIEGAVNKNLFTGYPQVPKSLEGLSPANQVKEDTSRFAVEVGKMLDISPIKIDAFVKGSLGGVGQQLTGQQNLAEAIFARFGKAAGGASDNKAVDEISEILQKDADQSRVTKLQAQAEAKKLSVLPKEEAAKVWEEINRVNPKLAAKIAEEVQESKLELTYEDKQIKALGVENGSRAKYVYSKLNELDSKEEKAQLWEELVEKKILSEKVQDQLLYLIENNGSTD